jgi:hypothetical protein
VTLSDIFLFLTNSYFVGESEACSAYLGGNLVNQELAHNFRIVDDSGVIGDKAFLGINPQEGNDFWLHAVLICGPCPIGAHNCVSKARDARRWRQMTNLILRRERSDNPNHGGLLDVARSGARARLGLKKETV